MKEGIIFDLDGTLWDSTEQVVKAWNRVLGESNETDYRMTVEDLKKLMGKTIKEIASIALKEIPEERAVEIMKQCCIEELVYLREYGGVLYPDLIETLRKLVKKYNLYIVSNCQEDYIETFLEYHELEGLFSDYENHGRTNLSKGENIRLVMERNKLDRAVYVGDTQGDYDAARIAGIPFIHAKYGFGNINDKDSCFINIITELPALIEQEFCSRSFEKVPFNI